MTIASRLIHYTRLPLDRCGDRAHDEEWIAAQLESDGAQFLLLHDNRNLLTTDEHDAGALLLDQSAVTPYLGTCHTTPILLGLREDGAPVISLDVSALDERSVESRTGGAFVDLRKVGAHIDPQDGSLLGLARGLSYWHATSPFCPRCGSQTRSSRGGHSRRCTNADCNREHFPRNDPAVIMLVEHRPENGPARCLLGRNHRFKNGMFSTLAGFVDVGESLEEAVRREVFEEAGIHTRHETYVASQPWPFPGSLMLGFRAEALDTEITVEEREIAEAGWFSVEDLGEFIEFNDPGDGRRLPRKDSIARYLIDLWVSENRLD